MQQYFHIAMFLYLSVVEQWSQDCRAIAYVLSTNEKALLKYTEDVLQSVSKSSVNGVIICEQQLGACVRTCTWFFRDMGRINTRHGMHVTCSVNRLRPVECSRCERYCHSAMEHRANIKFCYKLGKIATEAREILVQVYGRETWGENVFMNGSNAFAKGRKRLKMSHVWVSHRQGEPQKW